MESEVFLAESRAAVQAGEVRRVTLDMPRFDIEKMRQSYYQEKKAMRQSIDQFLLQWENGWKDIICSGIIFHFVYNLFMWNNYVCDILLSLIIEI